MKQLKLFILFLIFFLFPSSFSFAHIIKNSSSEMKRENSKIHWTIKVHLTDFNLKFADASDETLKNYLSNRLILRHGAEPCFLNSTRIEKEVAKELVTFFFSYECRSKNEPLEISYGLFYGDPEHKHLLKLDWDGKIQSYTFSQSNTEASFTSSFQWKTVGSFLKLGFEHILLGFDHILFVICLILGARNFKSLFWLATTFTLAHSFSLALSVLDIVQLSPKIVEPVIAASIVFLAVWDLILGASSTGRYSLNKLILVTFCFGLIHGLGFSSILKEANLERSTIVFPLACFNLGVEGGQILTISVIYPLMLFFRKYFSRFYFYGKNTILSLIILISFYWMIERIFF